MTEYDALKAVVAKAVAYLEPILARKQSELKAYQVQQRQELRAKAAEIGARVRADYAELQAMLARLEGLEAEDKAQSRDKREPGRKEKDEMEKRLTALFQRHFQHQREKVIREVEARTGRKIEAPPIDFDLLFEDDEEAEEFEAELLRLILAGNKAGALLAGQALALDVDWTLINKEALEVARKYVGTLIKGIGKTTLEIVRGAVAIFVNTPGFTLQDLADMLPFDEQRAFTIAVTETTRAYAEGQRMYGEQVKQQFPDVPVIKKWFTANDDLVCPICAPLDGQELPVDEPFYEPDEYNNGDPPAHVNCRCWIDVTSRITND